MPQTCSGAAVPGCLRRPGRWRVALLVGLAVGVGVSLRVQAATTWTVCASGCDYSRIKAAIAASTTLDGDTLAIAAGTYTEAGITVDKSLTLQGERAATTIVQAAASRSEATARVFTITRGVTVILRALTIQHGNTVGEGGGIHNSGKLTLNRSTVRDNTADSAGGIYNSGRLILIASTVRGNAARSHGGLFNNRGTLTLTGSTVSGNRARVNRAGGLYNLAGQLTLTDSTVSGNRARYSGGGLYNEQGTLTLTHSTVSGNRVDSGSGGGLWNQGTLTLTHSTVSGNTASGLGGGLYNTNYQLSNYQVTLTLTHSTVSGNAAGKGGGLYNDMGRLTLTNSLIANQPNGGDCVPVWSITSMGYNLDSDSSCQLTAATDRPGVDPLLGPLQDNGGPTLTHALLPGSPAIDAIPWGTNGCGTTYTDDQRGQARPQPAGGACDSGAYEVGVDG